MYLMYLGANQLKHSPLLHNYGKKISGYLYNINKTQSTCITTMCVTWSLYVNVDLKEYIPSVADKFLVTVKALVDVERSPLVIMNSIST